MMGYRVIGFCPAPEEVRETLNGRVAASDLSRLTLHEIPDQRDLLGRWARSPLRMFRALWMAGKYGRILRASLDGELPSETRMFFGLTDLFALRVRGFGRLAATRFTHPFVGLYFFPPIRPRSFPSRLFLDDLGFFRGDACKGALILNEDLCADLQSRLGKPVLALPDFLVGDTVRPQADRSADGGVVGKVRDAADGRRIVLLAGDISPRKGVLAFLELAEACRGTPWCFVVAGHLHRDAFSSEELERIQASASLDNVFLHLDRIESDQEFHALVASADVLYAAYPDFPHSSNQLIQSASHQVPILVADGYVMARRVREFHLGAAVPYGDKAAMLNGLRKLMEADENWLADFRSGCRDYCKIHSAEQFAREAAQICLLESARQ